ncbi:Methane oxygenase PmoA [Catalinimonas alkaloidigena]|uniref:Methane oxygenase PmoA n=1 Tax=Catalinimonas alkaloidigena TaxID=1075417 RepID=A0A1G9DBX3_9BACT|nr:PmoA family protein [Catalinimonas alkaloidigena]SDK61408.1 Methane oxygenase PmoA [Catalinimonas alkaloidigena]
MLCKVLLPLAAASALLAGCSTSGPSDESTTSSAVETPASDNLRVQLLEKPDRVDVMIDGDLFTSYLHSDTMEKPVLYPVVAPGGAVVTRGYPRDPRPGERVDHPHHVGMWFNYGDVNGLDFWNNSDAIPADQKHKYGTIRHVSVDRVEAGADSGTLSVTTEWLAPSGEALLRERTHFTFWAFDDSTRLIDRVTTLTALDKEVAFHDNKEGMIAIRVARGLEMPSDQPEIFTDANGNPTEVAEMNNAGVTGDYLTSEGKTGDAAWGTRARWTRLQGTLDGQPTSITIIDHPSNPGYPTYWHARGYGLFAANPLGQSVFSEGKEAMNFSLPAGESTTFRYRVVFHSGSELSEDQIEQIAGGFRMM